MFISVSFFFFSLTPNYSFLNSAFEVHRKGRRVYIGITTHPYYFEKYGLDDLVLTNDLYEFKGYNNELVSDVLRHGYYHHSDSPQRLHEMLLGHHVTLVFERR
jgi:hypothetical protein